METKRCIWLVSNAKTNARLETVESYLAKVGWLVGWLVSAKKKGRVLFRGYLSGGILMEDLMEFIRGWNRSLLIRTLLFRIGSEK